MNQRGFTLIELLIAITILAVIVGIMGTVLSLSYQAMGKGEEKIDHLERKKMMYSLIESQIQSAFPSYEPSYGGQKVRFSGEKEMIVFTSNYSIWQGTKGNCLVKYNIESGKRDKRIIHIEETILGTDVKKETILATEYNGIEFEYFQKNSLVEEKWVDQWPNEEKNLPQKVRIHFKDGMNAKVFIINVFAGQSSAFEGNVTSLFDSK